MCTPGAAPKCPSLSVAEKHSEIMLLSEYCFLDPPAHLAEVIKSCCKGAQHEEVKKALEELAHELSALLCLQVGVYPVWYNPIYRNR